MSLELIKKLRETTGCGIADCNKALKANDNNVEKSVDWLRTKGLSSAGKKSGRITSEGAVCVYKFSDTKMSVVEVNSETDFVAKNDKFQNFTKKIAELAINFGDDVEAFTKSNFSESATVEDEVKNQIAVIGENLSIRRISALEVSKGAVINYIHNATAPNIGKIAVLVALESDASVDKLEEIGKQIAMHIAAAKPEALNIESVSSEKLSRESEVLKEQARASGKPESIIEKMIQGRIRKYYEEVVLLEQNFVMDDKQKIKDLIADFSKENGATKISSYKLFILGEGIEKKEDDFAAEVASMTK